MNGRTKISQFLVSAEKTPPRSIRQLYRHIPACTLVFLSEGVAERTYGPAERAALTRARSWGDFIDGWLPIEVVLRAAASVRTGKPIMHGDTLALATESASPWPDPAELDVRVCATSGGSELRLGVNLLVSQVGEAPRLIATVFMDGECPLDE